MSTCPNGHLVESETTQCWCASPKVANGWQPMGNRLSQPKTANGLHNDSLATLGEVGNLRVSRPSIIRLADVKSERVHWLWPRRIPRGKLTVLDGDPGLGKSCLSLDIAARASSGRAMPDGSLPDFEGGCGVVLLSAEDGLGDTIRPRLEAAGAELSRIVALTAIRDAQGERLPTVEDIPAIEEAIRTVDAGLVVIDPFVAYLDGETTNANRDQDVRRALAPLAELAERTGVALVVIRHLNKAVGNNPLYRGGASIGIIAAARSGLLVAKDPSDPNGPLRILASTKSNLAAPPVALAYFLEPLPDGSVRVVWSGTSEHTASTLLAVPTDEGERGALEEAKDVLRQILEDGPLPAGDAMRKAKDAGVAERTVNRAKQVIGVKAVKTGFGSTGRWLWSLPDEPKVAKEPLDCQENLCRPTGSLSDVPFPRACRGCGQQYLALSDSSDLCDVCEAAS